MLHAFMTATALCNRAIRILIGGVVMGTKYWIW